MKRILAILILLAMLGSAQAQVGKMLFSQWKLKSAGVSFGLEQDRIIGFSGESFMRMSGNQDLFTYMGLDVADLDYYSSVVENPHTRIQAIFQPQLLPNIEVLTSLVAVVNRIDGMTYYSPYQLQGYNDYLTLSAWGHEVAADMALIRRASLFGFSVYGGFGTNLGFTFGNDLEVNASFERRAETNSFTNTGFTRVSANENDGRDYYNESFDLNSGISQRFYAQAGASYTFFKRLEFGLEGRYGIGYRTHFDGKAIGTNLQSFGFFTRWNLR